MSINFKKEHKNFLSESAVAQKVYEAVEKEVYKNFIFDIATYLMECVIKNQISNTWVFNRDSFSFLDKTNSSRVQALRKNLNERSQDEVLPRSIKHIIFSRGIAMTSLALLTPVSSSKNAPLFIEELKTEFEKTYTPKEMPKKKI